MQRASYDDDTIRSVVLYGGDTSVPARTAKEWRAHWREHENGLMHDPQAKPRTRVARVCAAVHTSAHRGTQPPREHLTAAEFRDRLAGVLIECLDFECAAYPTLPTKDRHRFLLMLMDRYTRLLQVIPEAPQPSGQTSLEALLAHTRLRASV